MSDNEKARRPRGPEPDTLKIVGPWEEAVARALRAPIPPGGVPERVKPKRPRRKRDADGG